MPPTFKKKKYYLSVIVLQLQVHLYSFICHLQVVSHGTIAYIYIFFCWFYWFKSEETHFQKLWPSLERREKQALRATKYYYWKQFIQLLL